MKAGIIGTGFAAEVHMKALRACNVSVDVVMSQREEHAKAFAKKWGIPKWVTSVEAIMESRGRCDPYLHPAGYTWDSGKIRFRCRKTCIV